MNLLPATLALLSVTFVWFLLFIAAYAVISVEPMPKYEVRREAWKVSLWIIAGCTGFVYFAVRY